MFDIYRTRYVSIYGFDVAYVSGYVLDPINPHVRRKSLNKAYIPNIVIGAK